MFSRFVSKCTLTETLRESSIESRSALPIYRGGYAEVRQDTLCPMSVLDTTSTPLSSGIRPQTAALPVATMKRDIHRTKERRQTLQNLEMFLKFFLNSVLVNQQSYLLLFCYLKNKQKKNNLRLVCIMFVVFM